ncbi:MAG TPA: hypothetical protein VN999_18100 [Thermoanaerobaculia bacterium]|nr:hypothetical protein [Thermoanaerobaculia bacterium]
MVKLALFIIAWGIAVEPAQRHTREVSGPYEALQQARAAVADIRWVPSKVEALRSIALALAKAGHHEEAVGTLQEGLRVAAIIEDLGTRLFWLRTLVATQLDLAARGESA